MAKNCLHPLCLMEAISVAFDGENTELNLKKLDRMWNKQRKNSCQIQECSNLIIAIPYLLFTKAIIFCGTFRLLEFTCAFGAKLLKQNQLVIN